MTDKNEFTLTQAAEYATSSYQHREKHAGEEAAEQLTRFLNSASGDALEAFAEKLTQRTHRTLQQLAFGLFLKCIRRWGALANWDARNEQTVAACKSISATTDDVYLPFI